MQRKIQLSGFYAYPDGWPSQLIRIIGVMLFNLWLQLVTFSLLHFISPHNSILKNLVTSFNVISLHLHDGAEEDRVKVGQDSRCSGLYSTENLLKVRSLTDWADILVPYVSLATLLLHYVLFFSRFSSTYILDTTYLPFRARVAWKVQKGKVLEFTKC